MEKANIDSSLKNCSQIHIPNYLIWAQSTAFLVLYGFWMLPEIVGFRNTALVLGALLGLYPIYQYRYAFSQKRALPICLILGLFAWVLIHFFFLASDSAAELIQLNRIWKYTALGSLFALGLGISLANGKTKQKQYWALIYLGLSLPVLIYLLKYLLTTHGAYFGIEVPAYLRIYFSTQPYYVPKTDYVSFCLPTLAISLGQIQAVLVSRSTLKWRQYGAIAIYLAIIAATLFLFFIQNIKNGMAYAALCIGVFVIMLVFQARNTHFWRKIIVALAVLGVSAAALYPHIQENDSWKTLVADTRIAFQLDKYQQWKYAGAQGYPNNEYGKMVSITNYERAAWFKVGLQLASQNPWGYGLVEDSFKKMAKARWPEVSPNLSHSHSGWLDVVLALGFPGFLCILMSLIIAIKQSSGICEPWRGLVFWSLTANLVLWCTTEVSSTITFAVLIFWISWGAGLTLIKLTRDQK